MFIIGKRRWIDQNYALIWSNRLTVKVKRIQCSCPGGSSWSSELFPNWVVSNVQSFYIFWNDRPWKRSTLEGLLTFLLPEFSLYGQYINIVHDLNPEDRQHHNHIKSWLFLLYSTSSWGAWRYTRLSSLSEIWSYKS